MQREFDCIAFRLLKQFLRSTERHADEVHSSKLRMHFDFLVIKGLNYRDIIREFRFPSIDEN